MRRKSDHTGIDCKPEDVIKTLKLYTGRIIGLNLEPVGDISTIDDYQTIPEGRKATRENALKAMETCQIQIDR